MHRKTATNATEQQREDRHHDVKRQHLLLFLLTVLGKRLKLLLLGLLSSAFACSDHRCVCALIVDVGRRGRKRRRGKRETGQEEARQRAGKLRRQQLENPGEAMKTFCCWPLLDLEAAPRRAGAGEERELGPSDCRLVAITGRGFVLLLVDTIMLCLCGAICCCLFVVSCCCLL